ncbi:MAG: UTRA domain-containing protein [Actinophytocola sp.]|nr:UTRA domain-containing protein [Actinophytocola sp.]
MVDHASGIPAYRQVAADLRDQITRGDLPPGARIPSEHQLAERHHVSRPTVREAIALLRAEGLVVAERGRGVFVRSQRTVQRLARNRLSRAARQRDEGAFKGDAAAGGWTPSTTVKVYFESADPATATLLDVDEGTEVCVRDRVMRADGIPVQLATSRLPRDITRDTAIEQTDTGPGGLYARLEDAEHTLDHFVETVSARMATHVEQAALQLPEGTPVIALTRVAYDTDGRALEVNAITMSADRYELVYELPAD